MDTLKNFAISELAAAISATQETLTLKTGEGSRFAASNFDFIIFDKNYTSPSLAYHAGKAAIYKCLSRTNDVITCQLSGGNRQAQQGTSAITHGAGDIVLQAVTAKLFEDLPSSYFGFMKIGSTQYTGCYGSSCFLAGFISGTVTYCRLYAHPIVIPKTMSFDQILFQTRATYAGKYARVGIYSNLDSLGLYPNLLLLDSGQISLSVAEIKVNSISITLTPGVYWIAIVANVAASMACYKGSAYNPFHIPILGHSSIFANDDTGVGVYVSTPAAGSPAFITPFPSLADYSGATLSGETVNPAVLLRRSA